MLAWNLYKDAFMRKKDLTMSSSDGVRVDLSVDLRKFDEQIWGSVIKLLEKT